MDNQEELDDRFLSLFKAASFIARYKGGVITPEEEKTLQDWLNASTKNQEWFNELTSIEDPNEHLIAFKEFQKSSKEELIRTFENAGLPSPVKRRNRITTIGALAVLVISGTIYYTVYRNHPSVLSNSQQTSVALTDLPPGGNRAMLTLSDGKTIALDSTSSGLLTKQGNTQVLKTGSGTIDYQSITPPSVVVFNTITTPRGATFQVTLADGTKVWLNAGSSLRYPVSFEGMKQRGVSLSGEGYFMVAHHKAPFIIHVGNNDIQDLGTSFNVNAYDGGMQTTLIEGSVQVAAGGKKKVLVPGEQASINADGDLKVISNVDTDEIVAWKDGRFQFDGADITDILRAISRWYDVDVIDHSGITQHFVLTVPRSVPLSVLMSALERTNKLHYRIDGKSLIIEP